MPDAFDASAVELMRALATKAKPAGHLYPFTMYSYKCAGGVGRGRAGVGGRRPAGVMARAEPAGARPSAPRTCAARARATQPRLDLASTRPHAPCTRALPPAHPPTAAGSCRRRAWWRRPSARSG